MVRLYHAGVSIPLIAGITGYTVAEVEAKLFARVG
jgi:hypothetical protein